MKVLIGTPSHEGTVCCDYAIAMCEVFRLAKQHGHDLRLHFNMYSSLVQKSRNKIFKIAYDGDYDALIWIDADQGFKPEAFFKILEHPVDVAAIPVRLKLEEESYNIWPSDPAAHTWDDELKLLQVKGVGTGFFKLSREAIKVLWDQGEVYHDNGNEHRMICNVEVRGGKFIGEDHHICELLTEAGYPIYVDIETTCDHYGPKRFRGSYVEYCYTKAKERANDIAKNKQQTKHTDKARDGARDKARDEELRKAFSAEGLAC